MAHVRTPAPTSAARFADLPFGEQLMVWAMRLWARTDIAKPQLHALLQKGFTLAGISAAHGAFDGLMTVVATAATRPIDIRCATCGEISDDEQCLLGALADLQQPGAGFPGDAGSGLLLSAWLPAAAQRLAHDPAADLAHVLARAGLVIRHRPGGPDPSPAGPLPAVAAVTVH